MQPFEYRAPETLAEGLDALARHGDEAKLLAGGQSLLILMRQRLVAPAVVIDLKRIAGLDTIGHRDGRLRIGATASHRAVAESTEVRRDAPLLARAAGSVGSIHIRNRGTIGGSLAHADPAGDAAVALIVLDASIEVTGSDGTRAWPADDFVTGLFESRLGPAEILTGVTIPAQPAGASFGYRRFSVREGEFPFTQAAVRLEWTDQRCVAARVAVGGAGDRPFLLGEAARSLVGERLDGAVPDRFRAEVLSGIDPLDDVRGSAAWRARVVVATAVRAVQDAVASRGLA